MNKKKATYNSPGGLVYSTNPDFKLEESSNEEMETPAPAQQKLRLQLDKKQRAGKVVTLITGFTGKEADREALGKKVKTFCGTGGSVKDDDIMVQGDHRDKLLQWLLKNGYTATKKV